MQALGAGQRNIAAAMVVATMNFGNDEVVMVVVYSLIVMVILIPLALELGKRAKVVGIRGRYFSKLCYCLYRGDNHQCSQHHFKLVSAGWGVNPTQV
jgi:hypothetical protein